MTTTRFYPALVALMLVFAAFGCGEDTDDPNGGNNAVRPKVATTLPTDGGAIPADGALQVVFSKAVTESSVIAGVIVIGVDVRVAYDAATFTATITPTEPLESGAAYTLVIRDITDATGNEIADVVNINFTVE
ncbi:MAG: Ig-like domain-containing protein [Candidatus Poribacteria bacterium]|nr:Ig-like domain-containing protein [Candidatus Poribacteria bacterium]